MADRSRLARPRVVLPLFAALLVVMVLFTPTSAEQRGQLSSHSTAAGGARGLYDLTRRLGWRVERRTAGFTAVPDSAAVYAVLEPTVTLTAGEVHRLLTAVRAGAGLLAIVPAGSALADSLGIQRSSQGGALPPAPDDFCPDSLNRQGLITWQDGRVHSWWLRRYPEAGAIVFATVTPTRAELLLDERSAARDSSRSGARPSPPRVPLGALGDSAAPAQPAIVGLPVGRGRVVVIADPDLLRNDVLRVCRWNTAVLAMLTLEWLAEAGGRRLVFDEFHHGYGAHADPLGATGDALVGTAPGRAVLQLAAAALVLLAAAGMRPLAPAPRPVIERRSPLEHVGALARAYEQVGATRLTARRLVRGLRRRHAVGAHRTGSDEAFLHAVAARRPTLAADVRRLEHAMTEGVSRDELAAVGESVARIDQHLRPDR